MSKRRKKNPKQNNPPPHLPPPTLKKRQSGWGKRNKNKPSDPTAISILDGGWSGEIKLLDPARGAPAPPRNSEMRFKTGCGGATSATPVPVYARKGPFPFQKLPPKLQLRVVECVLDRGGRESWNIWETSRHVRDLCEKIQIGKQLEG